MKTPADMLTTMGEKIASLPYRTRLWLAILGVLLLLGSSVYKLSMSLQQAKKPIEPASTQELIEPMETLFHPTRYANYQRHKQHTMSRLDSLAKVYLNNKQP